MQPAIPPLPEASFEERAVADCARDLAGEVGAGADSEVRSAGLTGAPDLAGAAALCRELMIARPAWRLGAQGPDAFDCWSMLALIEKRLFGREVEIGLPRGAMSRTEILRAFAGGDRAAAMHAQWRRREGPPQHGDGVLMSHKAAPHHCGVFLALDRGVVAHHAEHGGFSVDKPVMLRLAGYADLSFFEWIGDCG